MHCILTLQATIFTSHSIERNKTPILSSKLKTTCVAALAASHRWEILSSLHSHKTALFIWGGNLRVYCKNFEIVQGDNSGRRKPLVDFVLALLAAGGPLLQLPTAQAGCGNIPKLFNGRF